MSNPSSGLRPVSASTQTLPPRDKFSFWNEVICRTVVDLDCRPIEQPRFEASIGGFDAPGLGVYDIRTRAHLVYRGQPQIARLDGDALIINYVTEGSLHAEQDGRSVQLPVGDAAISDAARPYFLGFDRPLGCVSVKILKSALAHRVPGIERLTARSLAQGSSLHPLARDYMRQLIAAAPGLSAQAGLKAAEVFKELLAASLHEALQAAPAPLTAYRQVALLRVKRFVEDRLGDPALSPDMVAGALRLSKRYINQLLAAESSSLGRLIWQRRIERCAERLRDPSWAAASISTIALDLGFNDLSHFSRAFRARYGQSPRDYRHAQGSRSP